MKTKHIITAALLAAALLTSCTAPASWEGTPNPLNKPGDDGSPASVAEMHRKNVAWITKNPAYR